MIRTLIIGAGGIAQAHVSSINRIKDMEVAGVIDINYDNAKKIAQKCNAKVYDNMHEALQNVDMVHLLTPPSKRVEYALQAVDAGKHIICEKPIATSINDARMIIDAANRKGVLLMPAFNHRFRAGYEKLQEIVKSGKLGKVVNFWSYRLGAGSGFGKYGLSQSWRTDPNLVCGMTIESLSHDIDMMNGLVGHVNEIYGNTFSTLKDLPSFDNNANVCFRLQNGGTALIHASWSSHISYSSRGIIGTEGTAMIQGNDLWDFEKLRIKTNEMEQEETIDFEDYFIGIDHNSYLNENIHFLDCVMNKTELKVKSEDGLYALQVSLAILESDKLNRTVFLADE